MQLNTDYPVSRHTIPIDVPGDKNKYLKEKLKKVLQDISENDPLQIFKKQVNNEIGLLP
jgi:hypothetical protein